MQGYETLWLPGMDHAGIATQALVERRWRPRARAAASWAARRSSTARWEWKAEHGGAILAQMRRLGDSVDWSRERFTMDEGSNRAVRTMFKRLYDDGLIYRAERMVNWSPAMRSVLVRHRGRAQGRRRRAGLHPLRRRGRQRRRRHHPGRDDAGRHRRRRAPRRRALPAPGRHADRAAAGRAGEIPVVADDHVDPAFGTGAVKVTPAHDPNDFEIGRRHDLPMPTIMDETRRHREHRHRVRRAGPVRGARSRSREALRAQGRIVAEKRPVHATASGTRSRGEYEPIEPRLSLQWFVKVEPLAKAAGDAVRDGRRRRSTRRSWSRATSTGSTTCTTGASPGSCGGATGSRSGTAPDGEVVCVGPDEEPPGEGWTQDPDVLDTWFSSGLWPFSTLGWPEQTAGPARSSIRRRCWSPATTSSSSGSPG